MDAGQSVMIPDDGSDIELLSELIQRQVLVDGDAIEIAEGVWAVHGYLPYGGEVLLREYDSLDRAVRVLECLPLAERRAATPHSGTEDGPGRGSMSPGQAWSRDPGSSAFDYRAPRLVGPGDRIRGEPGAVLKVLLYGCLTDAETRLAYKTLSDAAHDSAHICFALRHADHSATARPGVCSAVEAAAEQGLFWAMCDRVAEVSSSPEDVVSHFLWLCLDVDRARADLMADVAETRLRADTQLAARADVSATPTVFVNGSPYERAEPGDESREVRPRSGAAGDAGRTTAVVTAPLRARPAAHCPHGGLGPFPDPSSQPEPDDDQQTKSSSNRSNRWSGILSRRRHHRPAASPLAHHADPSSPGPLARAQRKEASDVRH